MKEAVGAASMREEWGGEVEAAVAAAAAAWTAAGWGKKEWGFERT